MIDPQTLSAQVRECQRHYTQLLERSRGWSGRRGDVSDEAMRELAAVIEELNVTEEQLRAQNEALLTANEQVDEERQHYHELFDTLPDAYLLTDSLGIIQESNQAANELFGASATRLRGKPLAVFVGESDRRQFRVMLNDVVQHGERRDGNLVMHPRQGGERAVAARVSRIGGTPTRLGWVLRDISDSELLSRYAQRFEEEHSARVTAERAARRFRFLAEAGRQISSDRDIESLCAGIARTIVKFTADHCAVHLIEDGRLQVCASADQDPQKNSFAEALRKHWRLTADDLEGPLWRAVQSADPQTVPELEPVQGLSGMRTLFVQLREVGPRNAVVIPLSRRDHCFGAIVVMTLAPAPSLTAEDIGILIEVAARLALAIDNAQLLRKLQIADREKTEFLGVISHELRTPLTAMIGYSELLLSGIPDPLPERARLQVERIRTSAWHQLTIVEQLLSHSRPGPAVENVQRQPVRIDELIADCVQLVSAQAAQKDIELQVDVPTALTLNTDAGRLRQILINLLWNGVKYTARGAVGIRVRGSDDAVYFDVLDTGPGIAAEDSQHVFDPYWRASDKGSGVGLGLSVSRKLARILGGDISVESRINEGSTFTLRLPIT